MGFPTVGQTIYGGWTQRGESYADLETRFVARNLKVEGLTVDSVFDDRTKFDTLVNVTMQPNGGVVDVVGIPRIGSNLTIPANVTLNFGTGGYLAPDNGVTVTVNGPMMGPVTQRFGGGGAVRFGKGFLDRLYLQHWGVKADGNDRSLPAQAAIDTVNAMGGGTLYSTTGDFTMINVVLKDGVEIVAEEGFDYNAGAIPRTRFVAAGAGIIIDSPVAGATAAGLKGIGFVGLGAGTACKGVRARGGFWNSFKQLAFDNFSDEGLLTTGGLAFTIEDILTTRCVLRRTTLTDGITPRNATIGAVDVSGTDHYLNRIEAGISGQIEGHVQSASLWCVGLAIRMSTGFISNCVGEFSDIGIHVLGNNNRIVACRGDHNYGHGWKIDGNGNQVAVPWSLDNSLDTSNTYDGYNVTGTNNQIVAPQAGVTTATLLRYGFNDLSAASDANKNRWIDPLVSAAAVGTAEYNTTAGASAAFTFAEGAPRTLPVNSATPSVAGYKEFTTINSNPTTITDFTRGVNGQEITIRCADSNTTVQNNGATIITQNAGNIKLRSGCHYRFRREGGVWYLAAEGPGVVPNVSADNGDAPKNFSYKVHETTQIWNTPLTANRKALHFNAGAVAGAKFRHVRRAGATGASTLDVADAASVTLKSLAVGQWCEVEFDGTSWILTAFGSL